MSVWPVSNVIETFDFRQNVCVKVCKAKLCLRWLQRSHSLKSQKMYHKIPHLKQHVIHFKLKTLECIGCSILRL